MGTTNLPPNDPGASSTPYEGYASGAKDSYGKTIKTVIGRHRHMVVYITEDNAVAWRYHSLPERLRPAIVQFQLLNGIARSTLGKKQLANVATLLGSALYAGLLTSDGEDVTKHFDQPRTFIYSKATESSRLGYVLLSMLFGFIVIIGAFLIGKQFSVPADIERAVLIGIGGGVAGSVISIVQRARDLKIDPLDSPAILGLHGLTRVALGAIFGTMLVAAIKSNIFLGHFSEDLWALFGLAAGAGFTERWVPELLGGHAD